MQRSTRLTPTSLSVTLQPGRERVAARTPRSSAYGIQRMPYDRVLGLLGSETSPDLFVLGSFARRVTVYSQQTRAVNLIDALHYYRVPLNGLPIAIIGAGAAGVTAAARAPGRGADRTLYGKNQKDGSIQQNWRPGSLHPTLDERPPATERVAPAAA